MLEIQHLHIAFPSSQGLLPAVKDVSWTLEKGKTLGIVGESGSGKSVSSLAIMRLLAENAKVTAGKILYKGRDLLQLPMEEMRKLRGKEIAMIFQEPMTSLNPVLTCGYQVAEAIRLHEGLSKQEAKAKVIQLFEKVELPRPEKIYDAYPHEISGGQKQRVMIAMAISCNPEILIADEPTTALDVTVQKSVLQLLKKLQNEFQMAMIFISHDLGVIAEIADEVAVMYKGEIVEKGSTKSVFQTPEHPYTQGLIACRPNMNRRVARLLTVADFLENKSGIEVREITDREVAARHQLLEQSATVLKVENLKTYFPLKTNFFGKVKEYVKAVDEVSFEVKEGETLGLVGESGCGKTTLGRSILRLVEPTEGNIWFEGKNLRALADKEMRQTRKDIQLIFQDPYSSLNPKIKIGEAILEPLKVHHLYENDTKRKEKVLEWLERVGLQAAHYERYPSEFSGGQRQRICIARALALAPKFVICDESVSALDVSIQAQILNLLKDLQAEFNFTYIFISHDLSVVKHIADRMLVMKSGKIIESGYSDAIYAQPQSTYTQTLLAAIPKGI